MGFQWAWDGFVPQLKAIQAGKVGETDEKKLQEKEEWREMHN